MAEQFSAADAKLHVADQDRRRALKAIEAERQKWDRAKANERKARERFEKVVAKAVTSDPSKPDWYNRPGPLPADQVREAAKLDSVQMHRLMEKQRKSTSKTKRRKQ